MADYEELLGGRVGKIQRVGNTVIRPRNKWTPTVHAFLHFMNESGADFVPIPYSYDAINETLSFISGDVFNYPLPDAMLTDGMLISAAKLLLEYHLLSTSYIPLITNEAKWMLPVREPLEVICHGDFAPYNVVVVENKAIAIIDFDTIHPGTKMWDISYAIYRWVPFVGSSPTESLLQLEEKIRKTRLFLDTYGVTTEERCECIDVLVKRLESLVSFMEAEAKKGDSDFNKNIEDGHVTQYLSDITYLEKHKKTILSGIGCKV